MAERIGPIHDFSANSPISAAQFVTANRGRLRSVPVVFKSYAGGKPETVGWGTLNHVKISDGQAIGTINLGDDLEKTLGNMTPAVRCVFDKSGALTRLVVELEDEETDDHEDCGCAGCQAGGTCETEHEDAEETPKTIVEKPTVATPKIDPAVKAFYDKNITKYNDDPELLAYALIGKLAAVKEKVTPDDHVALPKADADLLAEYRALGAPADLKAATEAITEYRAINPDPKKLKLTIAERDTLAATLSQRDRDQALADIAESRGYNKAVFTSAIAGNPHLLPADAEFVPVKRKTTRGEVDSFDVRFLGEDGKPTERAIEDYEAETWADLMPALRPSGPVGIARTNTPAPIPATGLRDPGGMHRYRTDGGNADAMRQARIAVRKTHGGF